MPEQYIPTHMTHPAPLPLASSEASTGRGGHTRLVGPVTYDFNDDPAKRRIGTLQAHGDANIQDLHGEGVVTSEYAAPGHDLPSGVPLVGIFTKVTVNSGVVVAYHI